MKSNNRSSFKCLFLNDFIDEFSDEKFLSRHDNGYFMGTHDADHLTTMTSTNMRSGHLVASTIYIGSHKKPKTANNAVAEQQAQFFRSEAGDDIRSVPVEKSGGAP